MKSEQPRAKGAKARVLSIVVAIIASVSSVTGGCGGSGGGNSGGNSGTNGVNGGGASTATTPADATATRRQAALGAVRQARRASNFTRQFTSSLIDLQGSRGDSRAAPVSRDPWTLLRRLAAGSLSRRTRQANTPDYAPSLGLYYTQTISEVGSGEPIRVRFFTDAGLMRPAGMLTVYTDSDSARFVFDITGGNFPEVGTVTFSGLSGAAPLRLAGELRQPGTANRMILDLYRAADGNVTGTMDSYDATGALRFGNPYFDGDGTLEAEITYQSLPGTVIQDWDGAGRLTLGSGAWRYEAAYSSGGAGTLTGYNGSLTGTAEAISDFDAP